MGLWAKLRALAITTVLFFATVEALPVPSLKHKHMRYQMAGEELDRWTLLLHGVGIEISKDELVDRVVDASRRTLKARWRVIRPWRKLSKRFKLGQAWGMFAFTDNHPGRLIVEGSQDGEAWEPVFSAPQSDNSALSAAIQNRRMRGIWDDAGDRPNPGALYRRWVDWVASRVFAVHPEFVQVRVRFERIDVWPPGHRKRKTAPSASRSRHVQTRARAAL
jgi:hypothetical protein